MEKRQQGGIKGVDWLAYQSEAMRTRNTSLTRAETWANVQLGFFGEVGELCDVIKKRKFHGRTDNSPVDELGDLLWYAALACEIGIIAQPPPGSVHEWTINPNCDIVATVLHLARCLCVADRVTLTQILRSADEIANHYGCALADVMARNVAKLRKRYPKGFEHGKGRDR
jgi:NTP pyrophosphatase (non-canonical NTP hydrolase)